MTNYSSSVPFLRDHELCSSLLIDQDRLVAADPRKSYLPGHPLTSLADYNALLSFVEKDLLTPSLDQICQWLWLLATPKSTHVVALHAQIVRGRRIVITEDPEMHLVWVSDRVFVKPLPAYLLSHAFWSCYLTSASSDKAAAPAAATAHDEQRRKRQRALEATALGYVRTYVHLIHHESDFRIAQREALIPAHITLESWADFIRGFAAIDDHEVCGRYHYGDLRLTRLNFWAKPLLRRWHFRKTTWQYMDYFARYFAPLLFLFAMWSLVLGSMQVGLQARPNWTVFGDWSAWFSVATLVCVLVVVAFFLGEFCLLAGREVWYAVRKQVRKRNRKRKTRRRKEKDAARGKLASTANADENA